MKRTLRRISATHNFVYEFNPFENSVVGSNSAASTKELQSFSNAGQGWYIFYNIKNRFLSDI